MAKQYEVSFRLGGELEASFYKSISVASADFKKLFAEAQKLEKGPANSTLTKSVRDDLKRTQAEMRNTESASSKLASAVKRSLVPLTAGLGAGALVVNSFKKSMDFEEQLSSIQALTGLTGGEMKRVHDLALDMGAKTKYSALEAAQGMEELLKAGMSTSQVIGGGLEASLNLAAAGGLGLADASEIMSTAMNAYRSDAISAAQASDILAGTANASATDVMDLKYSLAQVSAVASGVGLSFKDTNVALGLFANNGLKGSDAGTSLKTMLSNLTPKTETAYGAFMDLGLLTVETDKALKFMAKNGIKSATNSVDDIETALRQYVATQEKVKVGTQQAEKIYHKFTSELGIVHSRFYDQNGDLKDMSDIADILRDSLKHLNAEQRSTALYSLFGSDAIRAGTILYKEGAEGVEKFNKEMSNVTALDVAKKRMDNAKGAVEQFRGAMETLQISVLEPTLPLIKDLALSAADASERFQEWMNTRQAKQWGNTLLSILKAAPKLLGAAAVIVPTVKMGKGIFNAVQFVKNFGKVSEAGAGAAKGIGAATRAAGLFGSAATLLTNPLGLAITGVGLLTTGVIAYKRHQENARQALINMKDTLDTAYSNYSAADEASQKTRDLIKEYDRLTAKIKDSKTPAEDLEEARRKLRNVEQELIDMNPDILSAEDAKTEKFREQAGYVQQIKDAQAKSAKLDLEKTIFNGMANLPDMEKNLQKLRDDVPKFEKKMDKARKDYAAYQEFNTRLQSIRQNPNLSLPERNRQRTALFDDVQKYRGKDDLRNRDADLNAQLKQLHDAYQDNLDDLRTSTEELSKSEKSYKTLYDQAKKYIEMESGLSGTLEQQAKKYKDMSDEQKKKFDEEIRKIAELNDNLDLLPKNMKINLDVVYNEIGLPQLGKTYKAPISKAPTMAQYAEGDIVTKPVFGVYGEAGPEAFIPINNKPRSHAILNKVNQLMGHTPEQPRKNVIASAAESFRKEQASVTNNMNVSSPITIENKPSIIIQGNADESTVKRLEDALRKSEENFSRKIEAYFKQKARLSMSGPV